MSGAEDDLLLQSATVQARLLTDRLISARELLGFVRRRVEEADPSLGAVVTTDWERAEHEADMADQLTAAGRRMGPLHGLPMTVKDTIETSGMRTTAGAPDLADHVPNADAPAVARLRAAGAIMYGKSNVPTWAADAQTTNPLFGTTRNPWDLDRTPGGSSGGAAVAVATGMSSLELGSDLGGSIRLPAHFCGVYGLKPTFGIIPTRGHLPPGPGTLAPLDIAVLGPLARSAEDLDLALDVLAGADGPAATAWRLALPAPRATRLDRYRIGVWVDDPACPVDTATGDALEALGRALQGSGATVIDVARKAPSLAEGWALARRLTQHLAGLFLEPSDFAAIEARAVSGHGGEWERNVTLRAWDLVRAQEARAKMAAAWADLFQTVDVVLTPVTPGPAFAHDHNPDVDARRILVDGRPRPYGEQFAWLQAVGAVHLPAVVAPLGRSHGMPIGVQVVGPHLEDRTAIDVAARLTAVTEGFVAPPRSTSPGLREVAEGFDAVHAHG